MNVRRPHEGPNGWQVVASGGEVILIDATDVELVGRHLWCVCAPGYPRANVIHNGKWRSLPMHRILNPDWTMTDHINRDRLDNRRGNLRHATRALNAHNTSGRGHLGFKGVAKDSRGRIVAKIMVAGRQEYIGRFASAEDAARAYDSRARQVWGVNAITNFAGGANG